MVELTKELVLAKSRCSNLNQVKNLNLWGNNIQGVELLRQLPNVELSELYLRKNEIANINEVQYLRNLPKLRVLWLGENPLASQPNYRQQVLKMLPFLQKLDDENVSSKESLIDNDINDTDERYNYQNQDANSNNLNKANVQKQVQAPFKAPALPSQNSFGQANMQRSPQKIMQPQQNIQHISNQKQADDEKPKLIRYFSSNQDNQIQSEEHRQSKNMPQQINQQFYKQQQKNSKAHNTDSNQNIMCAVMALLKELNKPNLELIQRDIEKKLKMFDSDDQ